MQACALTVVDVDGEKIGQLASQLQEQGYTVQTVSLSVSDPSNVTPITAAQSGDSGTEAATAEPAAGPPAAAGSATDQAPDNEPFKCPACGKTYPDQVVCQADHEATATLPTADVLAGATVEDAAAQQATESAPAAEPAAAADQAPATTPPADSAPETGGAAQPGADPSAPAWPQ